jgi:hypothetical protein
VVPIDHRLAPTRTKLDGQSDPSEGEHMGAQRTSFAKLQRDRAKKAKAAQKRERRQSGAPETDELTTPEVVDEGGELSAPVLLQLIEHIHQQFDAKEITFEEFEEKKLDLLSRLPID